MTTSRFGFCCKWIDRPDQVNGIKPIDECKQYNTGATTVAWLKRQRTEVAEQKLWDLMVNNIESTKRLVDRVGQLDNNNRMVRLSSDILPVYTEPTFRYFWQQSDVRDYCERHFLQVGESARQSNTRLSFHPGQFTVLASESDDIVDRSIEEFEYHADMARWMGYGREFQDFKINVHISGRRGPDGIRRVLPRLSTEARNTITIENDEVSWGIDASLELAADLALVLDIHHHWISSGEYISADDDRCKRIIDSWRGQRPVIHYSMSREDLLVGHDPDVRPDMPSLLAAGFKKQKLRAHSDFMWNRAVNEWAMTFSRDFDIQVEAKGKNLAAHAFSKDVK